MVGNVLIDNIRFLQSKMQRPEVMDEFHLKEGEYMVLTLNRKAIVNNIDEMKSLISVIDEEARQAGVKVIAPLRGKALGFVLAFKAYQEESKSSEWNPGGSTARLSVVLLILQLTPKV